MLPPKKDTVALAPQGKQTLKKEKAIKCVGDLI